MLLLLLSSEFPPGPGGIGTHAYQLAKGFAQRGWQVVVLTPQDEADEDEISAFNRTQAFDVFRQHHRPISFIEGASRLADLLRLVTRYRPDIILASGNHSVWLAAALSKIIDKSWVAVAHGGLEFNSSIAWERSLTQWSFSQANLVFCVSNYTRDLMLASGIRPQRIEVITNGADEKFFHPFDEGSQQTLRQKLGLGNAQLLLTVGSVTERKGQEIVIRALPIVLNEAPDIHYLIVGLPYLQPQLTRLARQLGVEKNVHFLGKVDRDTLLTVYNACDIFIMTSLHSSDGNFEGYGIAAVEAALCGKPAVVSAQSGLAEAVINMQTGLHVPENNPSETAQAILRLLKDVPLRTQLGQQAYLRAYYEQTWESRIKLYESALLQVVEKRE
jgi:phosphatidylinositol alpha-1,6-mannosyltransferase